MTQERLHRAFAAFMQSDDLLQARELVAREADVLLSDEGLAYLDRYLEEYGDDPRLGPVLRTKGRALRDGRRVGIAYGFARLLLELQPEPPSDDAVSEVGRIRTEEEVARLVERRPELVGELQRMFAAGTLLEDLKADLQGAAYPPGDSRRVELCRAGLALADRRIDPLGWAAFAGELGNALTATAPDDAEGALSEAVDLYRRALEVYEEAGLDELTSNALFNLGHTLARRGERSDDGDIEEGIDLLERSLALRPRSRKPLEWAQARLALARALLSRGDAGPGPDIDGAIEHLEACLEVYDPEGHPDEWASAACELGNAWMARSGGTDADDVRRAVARYREVLEALGGELPAHRVVEVQGALERAYGALAQTEVSGFRDGETVEALDLGLDDGRWELVGRTVAPGFVGEDRVPRGDSLSWWTELVTVERYPAAMDMPFSGLLASRRRMLEARITDGTLTFEVLHRDDREVVYRWSVVDDFAIQDQGSVVRFVRGASALHAAHWVVRGRPDDARRDRWTDRLRGATVRDDRPVPPVPARPGASGEEIGRRLERLGEPPASEPEDPVGFVRSAVQGVERSTRGEVWAGLMALSGLHLLQAPGLSAEGLDAALGALRRSLEVVPRAGRPVEWGRIVLNLARGYLRRGAGDGDRARDLERARTGFKEAAAVFSSRGLGLELGAAVHGLGDVHRELGAPDQAGLLGAALELYGEALRFRTPEAAPVEWAETMLSRGDVHLTLAGVAGEGAHLEEAEAAYAKVLEVFASDPRFGELEGKAIARLMGWAIMRLNQMDREGIPEPRVPEGFRDREVHGRVLYLRPLSSAGTLRLPNRFVDPASFAVQFDAEPETLTVEAALYRALGEHLSFSGIAGRSEGLGGTRIFMAGGEDWQDVVAGRLEASDLVMMIPHDSPGVRWEVELLLDRGALGRTVFVMPPDSPAYDVAGMWASAAGMMEELGFALPAFTPEGMFVRLGEDGAVVETIPFDAVWRNELFARLRHLLPDG